MIAQNSAIPIKKNNKLSVINNQLKIGNSRQNNIRVIRANPRLNIIEFSIYVLIKHFFGRFYLTFVGICVIIQTAIEMAGI